MLKKGKLTVNKFFGLLVTQSRATGVCKIELIGSIKTVGIDLMPTLERRI